MDAKVEIQIRFISRRHVIDYISSISKKFYPLLRENSERFIKINDVLNDGVTLEYMS